MGGARPGAATSATLSPDAVAATAVTAIAGVLVGHGLAYLLAYSGSLRRHEILRATGHTSNGLGHNAALVALAVAGWVAAVRGVRRHRGRGRRPRLVRLGALAPLQVCGFIAMELHERMAAGAPLAELLHGHEFAIGVLIQVVVAATAVVLLVLTEELAARIIARGQPGSAGAAPARRVFRCVPTLRGVGRWVSPPGRAPPSREPIPHLPSAR